MAGYFPKDDTFENRYCSKNAPEKPAKYYDFTAWRCERGAELVFGGPIQFHNFRLLDNEKSGAEFIEVYGGGGENGTGVFGGLVVGHSEISADDEDEHYCTKNGIKGPGMFESSVQGVDFFNFDKTGDGGCYALGVCGRCVPRAASFPVFSKELSFTNSPNKVNYFCQFSIRKSGHFDPHD